jgi:OmpA-like transmembrane domain
MKTIPVIVLVVFCIGITSLANAAPNKRTRNQNRIGPYGVVFVGMTKYTGDHSENESELLDILINNDIPYQNLSSTTKDSDIGYQATFGYRFNRYIAGEVGLAQYGSLASSAHGDLDFGNGYEPADVKLAFHVGGPLFSVIGILPVSNSFEFYGRVGLLFASVEREFTSAVSGVSGVTGSAKGDSQNPVFGIGASWNINQVYSIRAEYQKLSNIGQSSRTGTEDLNVMNLGVMMRF